MPSYSEISHLMRFGDDLPEMPCERTPAEACIIDGEDGREYICEHLNKCVLSFGAGSFPVYWCSDPRFFKYSHEVEPFTEWEARHPQ